MAIIFLTFHLCLILHFVQINKPLIEKRRRARINDCLTQLKNIVLEAQESQVIIQTDKTDTDRQTDSEADRQTDGRKCNRMISYWKHKIAGNYDDRQHTGTRVVRRAGMQRLINIHKTWTEVCQTQELRRNLFVCFFFFFFFFFFLFFFFFFGIVPWSHIRMMGFINIKHLTYGKYKYLSRLMGKPTIYIGENKDADQLRGNREADQRLCFRYSDSTIPLLLIKVRNFKLLALFCACTGRFVSDLFGKPHCWFSHETAHFSLDILSADRQTDRQTMDR